jgi:hypothetical protein
MVRFQPDSWLEGLLRPLILATPNSAIYFEVMAPDWRFAFIAACGVVLLLSRRPSRSPLPFEHRQLLWGLVAVFYLWTFVVGNARYFMAGLVLAGPLLLMLWRQLPGTATFRWMLLAIAGFLQFQALAQTYIPNYWGLVRWAHEPGLAIADSPLRHQPAVFITGTAISYSILVPQFHPQSRWSNLAGQQDIKPPMPEYVRLHQMLAGPLPKYAVMPIAPRFIADAGQPEAIVRLLYNELLAPQGLRLTAAACYVLPSPLAPGQREVLPGEVPALRGFWFCPLSYTPPQPQQQKRLEPPASVAKAFQAVEQRCGRFFPPGAGNERHFEDLWSRRYPSDMTLMADSEGHVYFKYDQALNPTMLGTLNQLARGDFSVPCDKIPGRYVPFWKAE